MGNFRILAKEGQARVGVLKTAHGEIETPIFMPVGTQGTVKALTPEDLKNAGAQIILGNTYHLYLRPGHKLIRKLGGLHKFMHWDGPILTDSGGFQAFSLGAAITHGVKKMQKNSERLRAPEYQQSPKTRAPERSDPLTFRSSDLSGILSHSESFRNESFRKNRDESLSPRALVTRITEEGVTIVSHLDGSKHLLTPELSMEVQLDLGSDICLVLDELLSPLHDMTYVKHSLERTHRWELRSADYFRKHLNKSITQKAQLFGILQGVDEERIRKGEAKWIAGQNFDGVSIGGSFGVSNPVEGSEMLDPSTTSTPSIALRTSWANSHAIDKTMSWVVPLLPDSWPRHALGIGEVLDLFVCIERGVDMFDCVAPMRRARNGSLYISPKSGGKLGNKYVLSISRAEFAADGGPIDIECECYTCQNFSKAYLHHLYMAKELLYYRLATIHNVYFIINLVQTIRQSIFDHQFSSLKKTWLK